VKICKHLNSIYIIFLLQDKDTNECYSNFYPFMVYHEVNGGALLNHEISPRLIFSDKVKTYYTIGKSLHCVIGAGAVVAAAIIVVVEAMGSTSVVVTDVMVPTSKLVAGAVDTALFDAVDVVSVQIAARGVEEEGRHGPALTPSDATNVKAIRSW
jgi:hypothetical protein